MKITDEHTLRVCVDCLTLLANGEEPPECEPGEHVAKMARWDGYSITLGWTAEEYARHDIDSEDEEADHLGFSWRSCDGCGSNLGGDRFAATAWKAV